MRDNPQTAPVCGFQCAGSSVRSRAFDQPDTQKNNWRLLLGRDDLDPDRARVIELGDNQLTLRPLAKE